MFKDSQTTVTFIALGQQSWEEMANPHLKQTLPTTSSDLSFSH